MLARVAKDDNQLKIAQTDENYKFAGDAKSQSNEGDYLIVWTHPRRFPNHSFQKMVTRAYGPYAILQRLSSNAYLIDFLIYLWSYLQR